MCFPRFLMRLWRKAYSSLLSSMIILLKFLLLPSERPPSLRLPSVLNISSNACELGNAFSALNDPFDQRERLTKQVMAKAKAGRKCSDGRVLLNSSGIWMTPDWAGLGFGVDRFVMLLTDSSFIRDVLLFPTMKPLSD